MHDDTVLNHRKLPWRISPRVKSLLLRILSQHCWGAMGQVVLNQHFKSHFTVNYPRLFPSVCVQVNVWKVWGWLHPPWKCCKYGWRRKAKQRQLDFNILYLLCLWSLPSRCLFTIRKRLQSNIHPGRYSYGEFNFKSHQSVWSNVLYFFPISSICPELLLNCFALVMHTEGSSLYALLPDCSIIHYSPHWLLNMKHALSNKPLLTLGQQSVADRPEDSWDLERDRFYRFKQTHYGNSCHILHSREWCYSLVISIQASVSHSFQQLLNWWSRSRGLGVWQTVRGLQK